jgi:hypothetical protein
MSWDLGVLARGTTLHRILAAIGLVAIGMVLAIEVLVVLEVVQAFTKDGKLSKQGVRYILKDCGDCWLKELTFSDCGLVLGDYWSLNPLVQRFGNGKADELECTLFRRVFIVKYSL